MRRFSVVLLAALVGSVAAERRLQQVSNPATITVQSGDVIATPITPVAPYSQAALQCNVSGDSRIPGFATYPLTVLVPKGNMVRVIFANGNLGGSQVTQQGEPGVIVQQSGAVIVQQSGSASPVVQNVSSPIVQQSAPPSALVVQQSATVVQQTTTYQPSPVVNVQVQVQSSPSPSPTPSPSPSPTPSPSPSPSPTPSGTNCGNQISAAGVTVNLPCKDSGSINLPNVDLPNVNLPNVNLPNVNLNLPSLGLSIGRKMLQNTVPGGPNNGLVEYVALASANNVPGFVVPNTQFGVPYVEFSATDGAVGQTASFKGVLEVAVVVGGVPQIPFTPNKDLSPECQVNVNFQVA